MLRHLSSQLARLQVSVAVQARVLGAGGDDGVRSSSVYLGVDADITVFRQARVLMEGPELLQGIQVPILKVLQSTTSLNAVLQNCPTAAEPALGLYNQSVLPTCTLLAALRRQTCCPSAQCLFEVCQGDSDKGDCK